MKPYVKELLDDSLQLRQLLDVYIELRQEFQKLDFSESDLDDPPQYTATMMNLQDKFRYKFNALQNRVIDYGFEITRQELGEYLKPILMKINEITPLKNGNNQRNDSGNENN